MSGQGAEIQNRAEIQSAEPENRVLLRLGFEQTLHRQGRRFGRAIGRAGAHWVTIAGVGLSFALSAMVFQRIVLGASPMTLKVAAKPDPQTPLTTIAGDVRSIDDWTTTFHLCIIVLPDQMEARYFLPVADRIFKVFGDADCHTALVVPSTPAIAKRKPKDRVASGFARKAIRHFQHRPPIAARQKALKISPEMFHAPASPRATSPRAARTRRSGSCPASTRRRPTATRPCRLRPRAWSTFPFAACSICGWAIMRPRPRTMVLGNHANPFPTPRRSRPCPAAFLAASFSADPPPGPPESPLRRSLNAWLTLSKLTKRW